MPIKILNNEVKLDQDKLYIEGERIGLSQEISIEVIGFLNENMRYIHQVDQLLKKSQTEDGDLLVENIADFGDKHLVLDGGEVSLLVQEEIDGLKIRLEALMKLQGVLPRNNKNGNEKIEIEVYVGTK